MGVGRMEVPSTQEEVSRASLILVGRDVVQTVIVEQLRPQLNVALIEQASSRLFVFKRNVNLIGLQGQHLLQLIDAAK